MSDTIELIQPDLVAKLNSEAKFASVAVFSIREERIEDEINNALAGFTQKNGKTGAAIEVMMPMIIQPNVNAPGPLVYLEMLFRVKENPTINLAEGGTGLTAEQIGVAILQIMNGFRLEGILQSFYPAPEAMVPNRDFAPFVTYDVKLRALLPLPPLPQTASVAVSCPAETMTLTSEAGAAIYYTLDGSLPWPGNGAAVLYAAPVVVAAGTTVRTAAYLAGKMGSNADQFKVT